MVPNSPFASPSASLRIWIWTLAGPFAEPCAYTDYSPLRMCSAGIILLLAIAAHPYRPSYVTAVISIAGLMIWFLWGLANVVATA
jgi:hypothetical protein